VVLTRREELIVESQEEVVVIKNHVVSDAQLVSEVRGIVKIGRAHV
jgi:hypothetical protein